MQSRHLIVSLVALVAISSAIILFIDGPSEPSSEAGSLELEHSEETEQGQLGDISENAASQVAAISRSLENELLTDEARLIQEDIARLRSPSSLSELIGVDGDAMGHGSFQSDQILAAWASCSLINELDSNDPAKRPWLERLESFCDLDGDEEYVSEAWDSSGYHNTLQLINADLDLNHPEGAIETIRRTIANASSIGELRASAAWLIEIASQGKHIESEVLNFDGISWEDAHIAAQDAVSIYYCQMNGGCGTDHFLTFAVCSNLGCDSSVNDIESAIYRGRPPRHFDAVNQVLSFFYQARRSSQ
ncbi:hypothetical protein [Wenzhouxiangella marina]|uniref:Uncharacterized protein n=1 Tax=Wenzhouxiangella marina TaxID=1579979 RepID=A0A0K0XZS3_9GAMM|nr:hypothetical protein [Wenzhouxiangella marina]AKS43188.1 hypothetical protein WM2015_2831 [Wenzhouxiangella marina]MBB6087127.1 hypothetical protein [Wenzhouxiangella marina]